MARSLAALLALLCLVGAVHSAPAVAAARAAAGKPAVAQQQVQRVPANQGAGGLCPAPYTECDLSYAPQTAIKVRLAPNPGNAVFTNQPVTTRNGLKVETLSVYACVALGQPRLNCSGFAFFIPQTQGVTMGVNGLGVNGANNANAGMVNGVNGVNAGGMNGVNTVNGANTGLVNGVNNGLTYIQGPNGLNVPASTALGTHPLTPGRAQALANKCLKLMVNNFYVGGEWVNVGDKNPKFPAARRCVLIQT